MRSPSVTSAGEQNARLASADRQRFSGLARGAGIPHDVPGRRALSPQSCDCERHTRAEQRQGTPGGKRTGQRLQSARLPFGPNAERATILKPAGNMPGTGYRSPNHGFPRTGSGARFRISKKPPKTSRGGVSTLRSRPPPSAARRPTCCRASLASCCVGTSPLPVMATWVIIPEEPLRAAGLERRTAVRRAPALRSAG